MAKPSLRWLMERVLRGLDNSRARRPARRRAARPLFLEPLEDRTLLDATLQAISLPAFQPPSDTAAGASSQPSVSADGRYIAFDSTATNVVPGQTGGSGDNVFLLDRGTGTTTLVSHVPGNATQAPATPDMNAAPPSRS